MSIWVPMGQPASSQESIFPPSIWMRVPSSWWAGRVVRVKREMEAMAARASPRKPRVAMRSMSASF